MNQTQQTALQWLERGIATVPITKGTKKAAVKWKRYQTELPSWIDILNWYENEKHSLAVVCGWQDLVILDFDNILRYYNFVYQYPEYEDTLTVKTARGRHVYVYCQDVRTNMSADLDVKANGYCLTYPSVHPNGSQYEVVTNKEIMRVDNLPQYGKSPSTKGCAHSVDCSITINNYGSIGQLNINSDDTFANVLGENNNTQSGSIVSRIKARTRITDLFEPVKFSDNGKAFARCPMPCHPNGDRDPSLSLDLVTDRCQCISRSDCPLHGTKGNDVIDAYRVLNNLSFRQALAKMAAELNL